MNIFKQKTAVLIIDIQNGFLERGAPIEVPNGRNIIPRIKELIAFSRKKSLQVIWTQVNIDLFKNTQYEQLFPTHFINGKNILEKGSRNYEIVDALSQLG
jgi:nicotinamidase-related amidase